MVKVATKKETKTEVKQVEEKKELREVFALFKAESTTGLEYLYGQLKNDKGEVICQLRGWFNKDKKNPKEPDIRVYERDAEGNQGEVIASLWSNVSKNDVKYMTGITNENEKLVAWFGKEFETKRPYIRVYYSE